MTTSIIINTVLASIALNIFLLFLLNKHRNKGQALDRKLGFEFRQFKSIAETSKNPDDKTDFITFDAKSINGRYRLIDGKWRFEFVRFDHGKRAGLIRFEENNDIAIIFKSEDKINDEHSFIRLVFNEESQLYSMITGVDANLGCYKDLDSLSVYNKV